MCLSCMQDIYSVGIVWRNYSYSKGWAYQTNFKDCKYIYVNQSMLSSQAHTSMVVEMLVIVSEETMGVWCHENLKI